MTLTPELIAAQERMKRHAACDPIDRTDDPYRDDRDTYYRDCEVLVAWAVAEITLQLKVKEKIITHGLSEGIAPNEVLVAVGILRTAFVVMEQEAEEIRERDRLDAEPITWERMVANGWRDANDGDIRLTIDVNEVCLYLTCKLGAWILSDRFDGVVATLTTMGDVRRFVEAYKGIGQ